MYIPLSFRIASWLPLRWAHRVGTLLGVLINRLPNKRRDIAETNIALCYPHLDAEQREWLVRSSFQETGKMAVELGRVWFRRENIESLIVETIGEDKVSRHLDSGRGVILAAPHLGSWELLGLYLSQRYQMTSMYKPLKGSLNIAVRDSRERLGAKLVPADNSGVRAQLKALRRGELVGILPDQDPARDAGVFAPFFGQRANTPLLVTRLARKTKSPVVFAYAERLPKAAGFRIHFIDAPDGLHDEDPVVAATALNEGVARCIKRLPDQYWWSYPRFRRQPDGERSPYEQPQK